jgi:hypothetical protein
MKAAQPATYTCTCRGFVYTTEGKSVLEAARKALRWWSVEQQSPGFFSPLDEEIIKVDVEGGATHRMNAGAVR